MLDFNDLYKIQIGDIVHICRIIYYDKINDTYTISIRGNGVLSGIKEDELTDISNTRPTPIVENGIIKNTFEELDLISKSKDYNGLSIGDKLPITLNGKAGLATYDSVQVYAEIIGFDHNADVEGYGITFQLFVRNDVKNGVTYSYGNSYNDGRKVCNIQHSVSTNSGGWKDCDVRYDILGSVEEKGLTNATSACITNPVPDTLMSCLPQNLRNVMKPMVKWTDNVGGGEGDASENVTTTTDYLPLLSSGEVGVTGGANTYEISKNPTYEPFKTDADRVRNSREWWLRSLSRNTSTYFVRINTDGSAGGKASVYSLVLSPIFLI